MRGRFALGAIMASAILALGASGSLAGTVINLDEVGADAASKPLTMFLETDRLRITSPSMDMIFRGDQNKVLVLQRKDHRYMELTPASVAQMGAQMNQAMAQMKQKLAGLPEAQRKQIEAMMNGHAMAQDKPAAPQATYEKAGEARKVGGWDCLPYRVVLGGKPAAEVCVAKLSDLGLSRDDLKAFTSLGAFSAAMANAIGGLRSPMAAMDLSAMTKAIGFEGFPVQSTNSFRDASHPVVTTLKSIQHQDVPADTFELPAGYAKREFGAMAKPSASQ